MSDDNDIQHLTEIERITNGKPSYFDMDEAFCGRMRAAIAAGLESARNGVNTTPGTKNPTYISDKTSSYSVSATSGERRYFVNMLWHLVGNKSKASAPAHSGLRPSPSAANT